MDLEFLPNEVLLEIFDYIPSCTLIYSFYNLNQRINSIIHRIRLHLDLSHVQQKTFFYTCQRILPYFQRQITSVRLSNRQTINGINYYLEQSTTFQQDYVKTLILDQPTAEQFTQLILYFPSLENLVIKTTDYLLIPIEHIPLSLRLCRLSNCELDLLSLDTSEQCYSIEELNVKMPDVNQLFVLFDAMITLRHLTCHISENVATVDLNRTQRKLLPSLLYLKLNLCSIPFRYVERLVALCPHLTSLIYTYTTGTNASFDSEHIDLARWHELCTNKLPDLKTLDLHISLTIDPQRDMAQVVEQFEHLPFFRTHRTRIICEITAYKHILCTIPLIKSHLNNHGQSSLLSTVPNAYSRIRHLDLILNETMLNQQQHTLRCPMVHSFYLGLYHSMTPIEQQSRLLLNQSISFVYLKHFELYGTCITDGFVAQLLSQMTNLNSLTLPLNHLKSCQVNPIVRQNMQRITKLQLALTESLSKECVRDILIPVFPNLNSIIFAVDNKTQPLDELLLTMTGNNDQIHRLKYLTFLEVFALDQTWTPAMLIHIDPFARYRSNHRILHVWL